MTLSSLLASLEDLYGSVAHLGFLHEGHDEAVNLNELLNGKLNEPEAQRNSK